MGPLGPIQGLQVDIPEMGPLGPISGLGCVPVKEAFRPLLQEHSM